MRTYHKNIFSYSLTSIELTTLRDAEKILVTLRDYALDALQNGAQINNEDGENFIALIDAGIEGLGEATASDDRTLVIVENDNEEN